MYEGLQSGPTGTKNAHGKYGVEGRVRVSVVREFAQQINKLRLRIAGMLQGYCQGHSAFHVGIGVLKNMILQKQASNIQKSMSLLSKEAPCMRKQNEAEKQRTGESGLKGRKLTLMRLCKTHIEPQRHLCADLFRKCN